MTLERHGRVQGRLKLGVAMLLISGCSRSASPEKVLPGHGIGAQLDSAARAAVASGFSGAVLVARGDSLLLDQGYGDEGGRPIRPDTRFWIASIGKQFTSSAILRCGELGRLQLDQRIRSALGIPVPAAWQAITIRDLLWHRTGLPQSYRGEEGGTRSEAVARMLRDTMIDRPGREFHYSNSNYLLAIALLENACGQGYRDFVHRELWLPAGLANTGFVEEPGARAVARARQAPPAHLRRASWGNKAVFSTTRDLHLWYVSLRRGKVLSDSSVADLFAPGPPLKEGQTAMGWFVGTSPAGQRTLFTRGNEDFGPNGLIYAYPDRDVVVVILTHAGDAPDGTSWSRSLLATVERVVGL